MANITRNGNSRSSDLYSVEWINTYCPYSNSLSCIASCTLTKIFCQNHRFLTLAAILLLSIAIRVTVNKLFTLSTV